MELWDAYTKDGIKTGQTLVRGEKVPDGLYHMVCETLVRHADGSFLCMKRAQSKPNYPGFWEATAGGSALRGEDKMTCIRRELREETGLVCQAFTEVGFCADERDRTLFHTFVCTVDCDKTGITLQAGETEAYAWLSEEQFRDFLCSDAMIDCQRRRFYGYYRQNGLFRYRMLAADLDGTLLDGRSELSERTVQAVKRACGQGAFVTVSTGRSVPGAWACVQRLGCSVPFVAYNGAEVCDPATGESLYEKTLSEEDALFVIREGISRGVTVCIWSGGKVYAQPMDERALAYERYAGIKPVPAGEISAIAKAGVTKVLWFDSAERVPLLCEEMRARIPDRVTCCPTAPTFLEFFRSDVSKATAVRFVAERLHLTRAEVIAVGDGMNDLEMLTYAGLGVAMGNACDFVKQNADLTVKTNDEDGVAELIERYLL